MFYRLYINLTHNKWIEATSANDNYEEELAWFEHGTTRYLRMVFDDNNIIVVDREAILYMKRLTSNGPF